MLAAGQESALLRFSLGNEYLGAGRYLEASEQLESALRLDPEYSAAWKLLGRALAEAGESERAARAFTKGIEVAKGRGDIQAAREMGVFLKRLKKTTGFTDEGEQP